MPCGNRQAIPHRTDENMHMRLIGKAWDPANSLKEVNNQAERVAGLKNSISNETQIE